MKLINKWNELRIGEPFVLNHWSSKGDVNDDIFELFCVKIDNNLFLFINSFPFCETFNYGSFYNMKLVIASHKPILIDYICHNEDFVNKLDKELKD